MHLAHLLFLFTLPLLTYTHILTLSIPSTQPLLPASTRAHLTTHGQTLTAPLTKFNTFRFSNLTAPAEYNLDIYCRDWDFEGAIVVVPRDKRDVEVYRRNRRTGAKGARMLKNEGGNVEVRVKGRREYYEERGGCECFPFRLPPF